MYPIEAAIVNACHSGQSGTGDVAILTPANRVPLMPFAQIASRIGGAITVALTLLALSRLVQHCCAIAGNEGRACTQRGYSHCAIRRQLLTLAHRDGEPPLLLSASFRRHSICSFLSRRHEQHWLVCQEL